VDPPGLDQNAREYPAVAYALIESAKPAGVEPIAYLADVPARLPGLPADRAAVFTLPACAASRPRCSQPPPQRRGQPAMESVGRLHSTRIIEVFA
jgi:hypothetical protein